MEGKLKIELFLCNSVADCLVALMYYEIGEKVIVL